MLTAVNDGFILLPGMNDLPGNYFAMAVSQYELLRKAQTYRPYWVRLPEGASALAAYSSYSYQVHVKPGSWLWGLQAIIYDVTGSVPEDEAFLRQRGYLSVQVTETYSGAQLFSEFTRLQPVMRPGSFQSVANFFPLSEPKVVIDPGDVDVEVCNLTDLNRNWQLVLFFAEPYEMVEA